MTLISATQSELLLTFGCIFFQAFYTYICIIEVILYPHAQTLFFSRRYDTEAVPSRSGPFLLSNL